jgi:hypothetical protein
MFLLMELLEFWGGVVFVNTSLPSESINICQFVDSEGVPLVERDAIEALASGKSLCGCRVFDKGESISGQYGSGWSRGCDILV